MNIKQIKTTLITGAVMAVFLFGTPVLAEETKNGYDVEITLGEVVEVPDLVDVLNESLAELETRLTKYTEQKETSSSIFDRFKLFWVERTLKTLLREVELYIEASLARDFIDAETAHSLTEYVQGVDAIID